MKTVVKKSEMINCSSPKFITKNQDEHSNYNTYKYKDDKKQNGKNFIK